MPSNTPLPAAQLLALADELAEAHAYLFGGPAYVGAVEANARCARAAKAYRAARAASPVTLEEVRLGHAANVAHCGGLCDLSESDALNIIRSLTIRHFHIGETEEARLKVRYAIDNARQLAGEGGGR